MMLFTEDELKTVTGTLIAYLTRFYDPGGETVADIVINLPRSCL